MIAQAFLYSESGQGPKSLTVHIEAPGRVSLSGDVWECRVEIPGYLEAVVVAGTSPIQATSRAFRFVRTFLSELATRGRLTHRSGDEVCLDVLFGDSD